MKTERFRIKSGELLSTFRNECRYIFSDGGVMLIIIGAIFIYSFLYAMAYKNEVLRSVPVAVVDNDNSPMSRRLLRAFDATPNIDIAYKVQSLHEAKELLLSRKVNGIIVVPADYEKRLYRNEKVNLGIYADASYFLMYRQVFFDVMGGMGAQNANVEWLRYVSSGASDIQAEALGEPVNVVVRNMFNPYGGYASFVMPVILMIIIQQTLLIGIGMVGGTWREQGLYRKLIPAGEAHMSSLPLVLGKAAAYLSIYVVTGFIVLGGVYKLMGYPMNGHIWDVVLFLLPYLLSCIFLGIALSTLFGHRENSLLFMLFLSVPLLILSGASLPAECMPQWLYQLGHIVPSTSGVNGFIRIQTMGATLREVMPEFRTLWILAGVYLLCACGGMYRLARKVS